MEAEEKKRLVELEKSMNENQKAFCREYIYDWNATRAYKAAYKSTKKDETIYASASRLLRNVKVSEYMELIQLDVAKMAGISRLMMVNELKASAFSNISSTRTTWMKLKDFEKLSEHEKKAIKSVEFIAKEVGLTKKKEVHVKVILHDKHKASELLNKMLGWNEPEERKFEIDAPDGVIQIGYGNKEDENEE